MNPNILLFQVEVPGRGGTPVVPFTLLLGNVYQEGYAAFPMCSDEELQLHFKELGEVLDEDESIPAIALVQNHGHVDSPNKKLHVIERDRRNGGYRITESIARTSVGLNYVVPVVFAFIRTS